ncbi:tyrosyl-tRNA synthetase-like protein [Massarina eburnea CBS 473.64]|uniref:Tyrosine--tRNA ligase n=1 Tax=Massarina eburnea CBS 473.64 TaxID=1395130 RepID=A0A6A6S3J1_9PLEO|nr:tyrosyl-tRNA synthetase-like protein [Massarina eburnea CBS 473.64]
MPLPRHLPRPRPYICQQCIRKQRAVPGLQRTKKTWAGELETDERAAQWEEQAMMVRSGAQKSMIDILEERGFVKDIAGPREALDWLLTRKRIGAYVGVDPTAPSLHVGHLLPLMALYWMYLHGYYTVTLLGGGTVQIGDPSGRKTARERQGEDTRSMNVESMHRQLNKLWTNVKCLGIKHNHPGEMSRKKALLDNAQWLEKLSAVELMRDLGSGMRLGSMLARDSVRMRMESGDGMAMSEFCYPLFQAYDWWSMYRAEGVQLQLGGSDQYGNLCAGMDAVNHMRKIHSFDGRVKDDPMSAIFGLTTPLLTTASGEKFGKSAGNAVWLDKQMLNSFDLYQYFLRIADADVSRYLKLFTFFPLYQIDLTMRQHQKDESKRVAQHILAREIVELAHGAADAKKAETAHREAFSQGTTTFSLGALRNTLSIFSEAEAAASGAVEQKSEKEQQLLAYKQAYASSSTASSVAGTTGESPRIKADEVVTLPLSLLKAGSFPHVLYAAGLVPSRSEGRRLIQNKGAYVVLPNSGSIENPHALNWTPIPESTSPANPNHYLVDYEALVLRSGKSKIQVCRIVTEEQFEADGLTCPGWDEFKAQRDTMA